MWLAPHSTASPTVAGPGSCQQRSPSSYMLLVDQGVDTSAKNYPAQSAAVSCHTLQQPQQQTPAEGADDRPGVDNRAQVPARSNLCRTGERPRSLLSLGQPIEGEDGPCTAPQQQQTSAGGGAGNNHGMIVSHCATCVLLIFTWEAKETPV